jgi:hypothetical protein
MEQSLRKLIRKMILETYSNMNEKEEMFSEARITNPDSKEFVRDRKNFIGSHIFGENLGGIEGPDGMYVAYSYGIQFPAYVWYKGKWYYNGDEYIHDGEPNPHTEQHMEDMRPTDELHRKSTQQLRSMIRKFKKKHGIKGLTHTSVEPGEKN